MRPKFGESIFGGGGRDTRGLGCGGEVVEVEVKNGIGGSFIFSVFSYCDGEGAAVGRDV